MKAIQSAQILAMLRRDNHSNTLMDDNGNLNLENLAIQGNLIITKSDIAKFPHKPTLSVENCVFEDNVQFDSTGFLKGIYLSNCVFEKVVNFKHITGIFSFTGRSTFKKDAQFQFLPDPGHNRFSAALEHLSFEANVHISGEVTSLRIIDVQQGISGKNGMGFTLANLECDQLDILNGEFDQIDFHSTVEVKQTFSFQESQCIRIGFNGITVGAGATLSKIIVNKLFLNTPNGFFGPLWLDQLTVKEEVYMLPSGYSQTSFSDCSVDNLQLAGRNKSEAIIALNRSTIQHLHFNSLVNHGTISVRQITAVQAQLWIHSSNLGKTDFLLCDFSKGTLDFENSKLSDVFLSETSFPMRVLSNGQVSYRQAQLAFGQINTAYQKQGDTVHALEYQAREMQSHYRDLLHCRRYNQTTFNLFLNSLSNDFGRNWFRGILFTLSCGLVFYSLLILSSPEFRISWGGHFDTRLVPSFLRFLNPFRFFDSDALFTEDKLVFAHPSHWASLLDFTGRLLVAYGIYQTIQAFRRYGRR